MILFLFFFNIHEYFVQVQIRCPIDANADDSLKLNRMSCIMHADADVFSYNVMKDIHFP